MNMLQRVENWGDTHHPKWLSAIRILLGVFILWVGILFVQNRDALTTLINENRALAALSFGIAHYIVFAHTVGGLFIAMGLFTRLAALLNIPVLIGAVFFVHSPTGLFTVYPMMGLSILVLFLLIFFLVEGSGPISVDDYMRRHPEKKRS
ncbi:DoxX family protein [Chitinophaga nivalis]|uniref:DoxX family protein n=1 Tax=Chitinophaga nivalis TaxID=2991709 RepID=A0ABT3ILT4_9BACT|nr:DoxX family protein [Chitinophaga nivalis]MCW3465386.1 DoxX family protein [Chitinophaga nivalis]MCW3484922.1 DoxX family protein [Chitinophaga nivalis]